MIIQQRGTHNQVTENLVTRVVLSNPIVKEETLIAVQEIFRLPFSLKLSQFGRFSQFQSAQFIFE